VATTTEVMMITGANRIISESFRQHLRNVPGKHDMKELHITAIFATEHILQEV
jgi:hypothetical protein